MKVTHLECLAQSHKQNSIIASVLQVINIHFWALSLILGGKIHTLLELSLSNKGIWPMCQSHINLLVHLTMTNNDMTIIWGGCKQRVSLVETDGPDGLLVVSHVLVWCHWQVKVKPWQLTIIRPNDNIVSWNEKERWVGIRNQIFTCKDQKIMQL